MYLICRIYCTICILKNLFDLIPLRLEVSFTFLDLALWNYEGPQNFGKEFYKVSFCYVVAAKQSGGLGPQRHHILALGHPSSLVSRGTLGWYWLYGWEGAQGPRHRLMLWSLWGRPSGGEMGDNWELWMTASYYQYGSILSCGQPVEPYHRTSGKHQPVGHSCCKGEGTVYLSCSAPSLNSNDFPSLQLV